MKLRNKTAVGKPTPAEQLVQLAAAKAEKEAKKKKAADHHLANGSDKVMDLLKSPEKPSFAETVSNGLDETFGDMSVPSAKNTFLIAKDGEKRFCLDDDMTVTVDDKASGKDDVTAPISNLTTMKRNRIKFTIKIGEEKDGIDMSNATENCIEQINSILDGLANTVKGVKAMIWNVPEDGCITKDDIFTSFPSAFPGAFKFVETNLLGFNRFCKPGRSYKMRMQIIYPESVQLSRITGQLAQWKIPRVQNFVAAPSDSPDPVDFGTLTGSVKEMSTNKDFEYIFKKLFNLRYLGLTWEYPRNTGVGNYHVTKFKLTLEVDRLDEHKWDTVENYFNNSSSGLASNFLGLPMILVPSYDNDHTTETKERITEHVDLQGSFGQSIRSVRVSGVQLNNWYDKKKKMTLHEALMGIESITEKIAGHGKKKKSFFGRLFYAILFSKDTKVATFFYITANAKEARGVANGLPCFLKSVMKIKDPSFYCNEERMITAEQGFWNKKERSFQTLKDREESDRMSAFREVLESTPITTAYISTAHANTMLVGGADPLDDNVSRMTKGTLEPDMDSQGGTVNTGSTNTSKVVAATNKQKVEFLKCQLITTEKMEEQNVQLTAQEELIKSLQAQLLSKELTPPTDVNAEQSEEVISLLNEDDDESDDDNEEWMGNNQGREVTGQKEDTNMDEPQGSHTSSNQNMDSELSTTEGANKHEDGSQTGSDQKMDSKKNDTAATDEHEDGSRAGSDHIMNSDQSETDRVNQPPSYADMAKTPPRRRKGKTDEYEFGSSSLMGTGTQKKSNVRTGIDPFHQINAVMNNEDDNASQQTENISAKGLGGDGES